MEEDEDLHNKLKCDQVISDEQITADNAKTSTLETSLPEENARVSCVITEEIDTMEKDLLAKSEISEISKFSDVTANRGEKQVAEYREANKAMSSDIENSVLSLLKASFLSFQGTPRHILMDFSKAKCAQPCDEGVVIFRTVPRNQQVCSAVCQSER